MINLPRVRNVNSHRGGRRIGPRLLAGAVVFCLSGGYSLAKEPAAEGEVRFNRDIRPILISHCTSCHGGVTQQGGVSFVYPEQVLPPDGWVVEPGDPDASILMDRVAAEDPDLRMPPADHGPPLSEEEIGLLRKWIEQGAKWEAHWAYKKPVQPALPEVKNSDWPRTEIDRFILARLEEEGLRPADDAEPHRWFRRVSLDLIGLPPTSEELKRFLQELEQDCDAAYARAVDRLLASEKFGERWAAVWLDQVRYADSMGLGVDSPRTIWKYRDWVIRALNADMPYDEFTVKQMAGDLLPGYQASDLVATACHRLTQTNEEGGTDDEEFRVAAVLDRVNTTWQTWQGVTFGCVQCHDHPYDPFRHDEYYKFAAFFNNTADSDLGNDAPTYAAPVDPDTDQRAAELDRKISELTESIWRQEYEALSDDAAWKSLRKMDAITSNSTKLEVTDQDGRDEFRTVGTVEANTDFTLEAPLPESLEQLTAIRVVGMPANPEVAVADSEWGFVWSHVEAELIRPGSDEPQPVKIAKVIADEPHPLYNPQESLNEKSRQGFAAFSRIHYPRQAALVLESPLEVTPEMRLRVKLKHRNYILAAFSLVTKRGHIAVTDDPRFPELLSSSTINSAREELAQLQRERSEIESVSTPILRERPSHLARPMHVFERGLFLDKGEAVTPDVPASFPPLSKGVPHDRLALANWLVAADNPLTARVAVNRFWARLFGVGLVETEEDFGSSGEPPSHPELLDHLALKFQFEYDWSVKRLLRKIVLSSAYGQCGQVTPDILARDPHNRLLTRGPRHRLSAEIIRDQALALSGLLNDQMYGPPVRPPIPDGVWRPFTARDKWPDTDPGDPSRYRRAIYTYTKRSIPYPMFGTFDQPSREFCTPRRLRSNTPLQALEMLNSESFAECAEAFAERMQSAGETAEEQVTWGFEFALCRPPSSRETEALLALYNDSGHNTGLKAVATAIMNLDEVVMK